MYKIIRKHFTNLEGAEYHFLSSCPFSRPYISELFLIKGSEAATSISNDTSVQDNEANLTWTINQITLQESRE